VKTCSQTGSLATKPRVEELAAWERSHTKARRDKKEAERPHPDRKEVKINTEIPCRNPAGIESRPEKAGNQPEATIASSSEMAARSVWGESRSRVIESRNCVDRWSLRHRVSGGRTETPQEPGVEVRPGSKSRAKGRKGFLGTCEIRLSPSEKSQKVGGTGQRTPWRTGRDLVSGASEKARQRRVSPGESNEPGETESGSLSGLIVANESRRTELREPVSSQGGRQRNGTATGNHALNTESAGVSPQRGRIAVSGKPVLLRNRMP
jgi:hypothetical protein